MNCSEPEFWEERYRVGRTPWDQHGVPKALSDYLSAAPKRGTVLLPGCGSGYEVRAFQEFGWRPHAIDFSQAAVERARAVLGHLAGAVQLADFFADELDGPFDFIYERTFLCSFPPDHWPAYVRRALELLKPDGSIVGIFAYGEELDPPPFLLTESTAKQLFARDFMLTADSAIPAN